MSLTMSRRKAFLFPAALGVSAAAHLLLLFLWPYTPARPGPPAPEPIAVRLMAAPRPAAKPVSPTAAASLPRTKRPATESLAPEPVPFPSPQPVVPQAELEPQSVVPEEPLELAPPAPSEAPPAEPSSDRAAKTAVPEAASPASPSPSASGAESSAALAAELTATRAVLSNLRTRIVEKIRYPALARANGWKGTVLLELLLDERGALQGLAVRRSSGYAVLDRAAAALVRSVTPVNNPTGRPLRIEVPISYELKD
jgi:protein TonB